MKFNYDRVTFSSGVRCNMRVTNRWLIPFLDELANFLNHNFDTEVWAGAGAMINGAHEFHGPAGARKAKTLQAELRALLDPIVQNDVNQKIDESAEAKKAKTQQEEQRLYQALSAIVGCLNTLQAETTSIIRPANRKAARLAQENRERDRKLAQQGDIEFLTPDMADNIEYRPVRSAQSFLSLHGTKWAVDSLPKAKDAREYLLWTISVALREGELTRLRACRYCGRYFAAKYRSAKRRAHDQCRIDYWNKHHIETGYNKNNRKKRKRLAQIKAKKRA